MLGNLEKDTGFRVKVLCQNYPNTPGLAIRDYWSLGKDDQKDDKYIVLIVDQFGGRGNVLNFNVGDVSYNRKMQLVQLLWTVQDLTLCLILSFLSPSSPFNNNKYLS